MVIRYQTISKSLLKNLPQRTIDVIKRRFGLTKGSRETLEAIGKDYGITRERVRQIEEEGFSQIRPRFKNYQSVIQYFNNFLDSFGGFKREDILLSELGGKKYQNHAFFFLVLIDGLERHLEDKDVYTFWAKEKKALTNVKKVINLTKSRLKKEEAPLSFDKLFKAQKSDISKILGKKANKNIFQACLEISKLIQNNRDNEFGLKDWVEINPRGIKDKAYLVLKKQGKPLHFSEVASLIESYFWSAKKKVHSATVHNELIKDDRFVLVGRGLYALSEWGYQAGVVRDVILRILEESKRPLTREEIIKKVSEQRIVKANTILLNLQSNKHCFWKDEKGRYGIKKA